MRKEEFVAEYESHTDNSREIFRQLKAAGYSYLGGGMDATVWGRDEGEVLKVLMPSENKEEAEMTFLIFHDACQEMTNNPHVPKFVDEYSVFEINGTDYMQVTMEKLYPIPQGSVDEAIVWGLSDLCADASIKWHDVEEQLHNIDFWSSTDLSWNTEEEVMKIAQTPLDNYQLLFQTMQAFYKIAQSGGIGWDLHTENVMQRADGTLVITDPFYN